jgi:hypothetical protein
MNRSSDTMKNTGSIVGVLDRTTSRWRPLHYISREYVQGYNALEAKANTCRTTTHIYPEYVKIYL